MPDVDFADLIGRVNTETVRQGNLSTVALIVFNPEPAEFSGCASFSASFPVRAEKGAQPVTVRDSAGNIVPSRLSKSRITTDESLPPGRVLWTLTLEFFLQRIPPNGWRTYGATYEDSPESLWPGAHTKTPAQQVRVYETDCHAGDLPADSESSARGIEIPR